MRHATFRSLIAFVVVALTLGGFGTAPANAGTATWELDNSRKYVASDDDALIVSDDIGRLTPVAPLTRIHKIDLGATVNDVTTSTDGNITYVMAGTLGVVVYDTSNPSIAPVELSRLDTPGNALHGRLSPDGSLLYVAENNTIRVIDVSDPANPFLRVADGDNDAAIDGVWTAKRLRLSDDGNWLYGVGNTHLIIVDISDPNVPTFVSQTRTPDNRVAHTVQPISGDRLVVGTHSNSYIFDVSDPTAPTAQHFLRARGVGGADTLNNGDTLVWAYGGSVGVFDASDPTGLPVEIAQLSPNWAYSLDYDPNSQTLAVGLHTLGFEAYDLRDPANPVSLGTADTDSSYGLAIAPNSCNVYIADGDGGFLIHTLEETFSTRAHHLTPTEGEPFYLGLESFSATYGENTEGTVTFQVSTDDGTTWKYWDGSAWVETVAEDGTETSDESTINANIATLDADGGVFKWRAFYDNNGDHCQGIELDAINIGYADPSGALSTRLEGLVTAGDGSAPGDEITYTLVVTNTGNIDLTDVSPRVPGIRRLSPASVDVLPIGESVEFTGVYTINRVEAADRIVTLQAEVAALSPAGASVLGVSDSGHNQDETGADNDPTTVTLAFVIPETLPATGPSQGTITTGLVGILLMAAGTGLIKVQESMRPTTLAPRLD